MTEDDQTTFMTLNKVLHEWNVNIKNMLIYEVLVVYTSLNFCEWFAGAIGS